MKKCIGRGRTIISRILLGILLLILGSSSRVSAADTSIEGTFCQFNRKTTWEYLYNERLLAHV